MGLEVLAALGLQEQGVTAVTLRFAVNEEPAALVEGFAQDENHRPLIDHETHEILRYVRRFRLVPFGEEEE
jgi:hypothetical protein